MSKMTRLRRFISLLSVLILISLFSGLVAANEVDVDRIAGENRYDTAAKLAKAVFPNGSATAIIARGEAQGGYADGLSAATLAGHLHAPILLTKTGELPKVTEQALKELRVKTVYLVGGKQAISSDVETKLRKLGLETKRIAGNNRFETAVRIAQQVAKEGHLASFAFIVNGYAPADSMVSSPVAYKAIAPILQVSQNGVPEITKETLQSLGITEVYLVGGHDVITSRVENDLEKLVNVKARLSGQTRFETSVSFAKAMFKGEERFTIVRGQTLNLADAVGAAVLGQPILYVDDGTLPHSVSKYFDSILSPYSSIHVIGGLQAVSSSVVEAIISKMMATVLDQDDFVAGKTLAGKLQILKSGSYGPSSGLVKIDGTLYLDPGSDGNVTLRNINAKRIVVKSGGSNSIILDNVQVEETLVVNVDQTHPVRINLQGGTQINQTVVTSKAILDITTGSFGEVNIEGAEVTLSGNFSGHIINVNQPTAVTFSPGAQVGTLNIHAETKLTVPSGTSVWAAVINSPTTIVGTGSINTVIIITDGVTIENPPANVIILNGVTASIGGKTQTGTATLEEINEAIKKSQQPPTPTIPSPPPSPPTGGGGGKPAPVVQLTAHNDPLFTALIEALKDTPFAEQVDVSKITHFTYTSDNEKTVKSVSNGNNQAVNGSVARNGVANLDIKSVTVDGNEVPVSLRVKVEKTGSMLLNEYIKHKKYDRHFQIYVPSTYDGSKETPLLFYFHGMGGRGTALPQYINLAEEEGIIVVFPSSTVIPLNEYPQYHRYLPRAGANPLPVAGTQWDPGISIALQHILQDEVDDVGFVSAMIDWFINDEDFNIDEERVYATGFSSGGMFSYYLAVKLSDRIAAVAPMGATMTLGYLDEAPSTPISIVAVQGDADTVVPFKGGKDSFGANDGQITFLPFEQVGSWWANKLGITSAPQKEVLTGAANGRDITKWTYSDGDGPEVTIYAIAGHDHREPNYEALNFKVIWNQLKQYKLDRTPLAAPAYKVKQTTHDLNVELGERSLFEAIVEAHKVETGGIEVPSNEITHITYRSLNPNVIQSVTGGDRDEVEASVVGEGEAIVFVEYLTIDGQQVAVHTYFTITVEQAQVQDPGSTVNSVDEKAA